MTRELSYCKSVVEKLGKKKSISMLEESCLTDRECKLLELRIVHGVSLKECSSILLIEEDSVNKAQLKASKKLYKWLLLSNLDEK